MPVLSTLDTPLGPLVAAATDAGICLLEYSAPARLDSQMAVLRRHFGDDIVRGSSPHLSALGSERDGYFAGTRRDFTVPLVVAGTPFQERVWAALRTIPYGQTCSYEALADTVGARGAQRAVGHANGSNPISVVLPCHRLIGADGTLVKYGGGLSRKRWLLEHEGVALRPESLRRR